MEALNARTRLPKYVVFILDRDFLIHADKTEAGAPESYQYILEWCVEKAESIIRRRKAELFDRKPGALLHNAPDFIWLKMLKRPFIDKLGSMKLTTMRNKFNNILEKVLFHRKSYINNYILSIEVDQEEFLPGGMLTNHGKQRYWSEINSCLQKFERNEINLKPKAGNSTKKKKLPTPPRKFVFPRREILKHRTDRHRSRSPISKARNSEYRFLCN